MIGKIKTTLAISIIAIKDLKNMKDLYFWTITNLVQNYINEVLNNE